MDHRKRCFEQMFQSNVNSVWSLVFRLYLCRVFPVCITWLKQRHCCRSFVFVYVVCWLYFFLWFSSVQLICIIDPCINAIFVLRFHFYTRSSFRVGFSLISFVFIRFIFGFSIFSFYFIYFLYVYCLKVWNKRPFDLISDTKQEHCNL